MAKKVLTEAEQALVDCAVERIVEREKDLLLYGCYIEVDGERVDPMRVTHYERVEQSGVAGVSLVEMIRDQQRERRQESGTRP